MTSGQKQDSRSIWLDAELVGSFLFLHSSCASFTFLMHFSCAPHAGKVMQTRFRSGFDVTVHKIAKYAI